MICRIGYGEDQSMQSRWERQIGYLDFPSKTLPEQLQMSAVAGLKPREQFGGCDGLLFPPASQYF